MVVKKFGVDFFSSGGALTLSPDDLGINESGWTIEGHVQEDYYKWVNDFSATHPTLGWVRGDFESEVMASSEEAFQDFYKNHPPTAWDYMDI